MVFENFEIGHIFFIESLLLECDYENTDNIKKFHNSGSIALPIWLEKVDVDTYKEIFTNTIFVLTKNYLHNAETGILINLNKLLPSFHTKEEILKILKNNKRIYSFIETAKDIQSSDLYYKSKLNHLILKKGLPLIKTD